MEKATVVPFLKEVFETLGVWEILIMKRMIMNSYQLFSQLAHEINSLLSPKCKKCIFSGEKETNCMFGIFTPTELERIKGNLSLH